MNALTQIDTQTYSPIYAPNGSDLEVVLFVGNEGINKAGVRTLEGILLASELADYFRIEENSDKIPSHLKRQRDLERNRKNKLLKYFDEREDTVLPALTIFLSHLVNEEVITVGNRTMIKAVIPRLADRHIADGQNRHELYKELIPNNAELGNQTVSVKFLVSDSATLDPATTVIKQLFNDYHYNQSKPNASQNLFFDSSQPYSHLLRRFLDVEVQGKTLWELISVNGKLAEGNIFILKQLLDFFNIVSASTERKTNTLLKKQPEMAEQLYQMLVPAVTGVLSAMPLEIIDTKAPNMHTKAIYFYGCAWVARSIIEQAMSDNTAPDWSALDKLKSLPLLDMTDSWWINAGVVRKVQVEGKNEIKYVMNKGSEKIMGRKLARVCGVYPCDDI